MVKEPAPRLDKSDLLPLAVLVMVFFLSVFLLYAYYTDTKRQIKQQLVAEKILEARYAAQEIRLLLEHEKGDLMNVAGVLPLLGSEDKGKSAMELYFRSGMRQRRMYSFFVMDAKGRFMYSVPDSLVDRFQQDLSGEEYFSGASKADEFHMSDPKAGPRGGWVIVLSAPVGTGGRGSGRLQGVVAEQIDLKVIDQLVIGKVDAGKKGYAFLVDGNGRLIANQRSGQLYQIENSSEMLRRMMGGEEGSVLMNSSETGEPELATFSPVRFAGRVWSVGLIIPDIEMDTPVKKNLERTLLIVSLMSLAFFWSLLAVMKSSRYKAGIQERTRVSEFLMLRNRELSTLNHLSGAFGGGDSIAGMLEKAINIIVADTESKGAAVRLAGINADGLLLEASAGMPEGFTATPSCADAHGCLCGKVMSEGRPVFIGAGVSLAESGVTCCESWQDGLVLVPLVAKSKTLGVLYLAGLPDAGSSEEREKFMMALGNQLAAGVENIMQVEDVNRHSARASALFHTAQALTRSLDLDELLKIIMAEAASLLKVKRCMFMLYNEEDNRIDCRVALGFEDSPANRLSFGPHGVFWEAMEDGGVKVVSKDGGRREVPREFTERFGLDSFVLVPLMSKGKVLGFMVLEPPAGTSAGIEDLKLIVGFANQAAVAIETSSFYIRTVEKYNEDLQQLSTRIIEAQEEERKRISRDLHDELGQILTAIKINLDMVTDKLPSEMGPLRSRMKDMESLVLSALNSVRRISFELRPSMLDDLGLSTVIGRLVSDFRKRTGIEVELTEEGPSDRLSPQMEVVLYRVVQEALTNALKHAKAARVLVRLVKDTQKGMVSLYVEDDGVGFAPQAEGQAQQPKGFGLMGIKERVSLLGGNFRIFTENKRGTKLLVDIPWTKGEE